MSEKYRPSNGTEGDYFMSQFCFRCTKEDGCEIVGKALVFNEDEPHYPDEWTWDGDGKPTCTAFQKEGQPVKTANPPNYPEAIRRALGELQPLVTGAPMRGPRVERHIVNAIAILRCELIKGRE